MVYLQEFTFPDRNMDEQFVNEYVRRTCYNTVYPFGVLSRRQTGCLEFEPVTILYGGNGSGKTTALNVMAEALGLSRDSRYNRSNFFEDYIGLCRYRLCGKVPSQSRIITSDDVFDYFLNIRSLNDGLHAHREELLEEYMDAKYADFKFHSLQDYEQLKKVNQVRSCSQSRFVKQNQMENVREYSNGENGFRYFTEKIRDGGLYLLDEPENSLSPEKQLELGQFIEDSARFYGCQFIIATHSPLLLGMRGVEIYDMDENPVRRRKWTELKNVRLYYDFFKAHEQEF